MNVYGRTVLKSEIRRKTGRIDQLSGTRHYMLTDGKGAFTRCVDVRSGPLAYTVVTDRCMDISLASYKGCNLVYQSPAGEVSPAYYDSQGSGWMSSFFAGLLTTCGLTTIGNPGADGGEQLGQHGSIGNQPASRVCDLSRWEGDDYILELRGTIIDAAVKGDKLGLTRTIRSLAGESRIILQDTVENIGASAAPLQLLYHFNPGYPLLDEGAEVLTSKAEVDYYSDHSRQSAAGRQHIESPKPGREEENYLLTMKGARAVSLCYNAGLLDGLGLYVAWDTRELPLMTYWKNLADMDYVIGMEPCNCRCVNRAEARSRGILPMLEAGERRIFTLEIGVVEGAAAEAMAAGLRATS